MVGNGDVGRRKSEGGGRGKSKTRARKSQDSGVGMGEPGVEGRGRRKSSPTIMGVDTHHKHHHEQRREPVVVAETTPSAPLQAQPAD